MTRSNKKINLLGLRGLYRLRYRSNNNQGVDHRRARRSLREAYGGACKCACTKHHGIGARMRYGVSSLQHPRSQVRVAAGILLCALVIVASFAGWGLKTIGQASADSRTPKSVEKLATAGTSLLDMGRWAYVIFRHQQESQSITPPVMDEDSVSTEIYSLLYEFGAEEYRAPAEFVAEVRRFIRQYQERDRSLIVRALVDERESMEKVREILRQDRIPEDLAYMALVESGLMQSTTSHEGAAGFWQFTEITAREYGMKVDEGVDERLDLGKSTRAASRYLRDLILDFGSGSSVMLAMAAYNSGAEAVHRAVRTVKDPIKQRNFWYLYSTQALPAETREYVPKVFAAIIVGRNPGQFGF